MTTHRSTSIARMALALAVVSTACRPAASTTPEFLVGGTDYAFQTPTEVASGRTLIHFANHGKVPHEMALGLLTAGVSPDSVLAYGAAGNDVGDLARVVGILIANPGDTAIGTLATNLESGRTYMMICSFKDADSLPPHIAMGMYASFAVK